MSDIAQETFGSDARCFAMLLHLTLLIERFNDGPFKDGFQTAIEEAAAYLDHLHEDGGDQAQTLMEQMCGLVNGHFDDDGGCEVAIFSGPRALERATAFANCGFYESGNDTGER